MSVGEGPTTILLECMLISARLLYNRSNNTLAVHLRVLGKLLSMKKLSPNGPTKDPGSLSGRLLRYVIATCYRKMTRRLKHKTLSQPYIRSLRQVNTVDVNDSFNVDIFKLDKPSSERNEHDWLFLTKFFLTTPPEFQNKFPTLLKQGKMEFNKDYQLYTKDTCAEFHGLLILLLVRFEECLEKLGETRGDKEVSTPCSKEFKKSVELVMTCGYALQRLAHGAALRMHLKTIAPLLMHSKFPSLQEMTMPAPGETEGQEDEDLKAVQPFVNVNSIVQTHLWKSYIEWLGLIMVHFDAVEILVRYVTGQDWPAKDISIHILVPPPVGSRLLSWRELLDDSTLFPTKTAWNPPSSHASADITNAGILKFLDNALDNASDSHTHAAAVITWWGKRNLSYTINSLEKLKSSKLPGWEESATRLLDMLKGLQDVPERGSILDLEISDDIMAISQSGKFFATLASIKTEKDFGGTLHCEAFLASLLDETANVSKGLVAQMKVGYFSSSFLSPDSFLVKGSGNNYWNIEMLLPNMPTTARPPGEKQTSASQVYRKRRSQYHYSLHSAHMASGAYRGFNERAFWGPFETGAYSIHRPLRNIASSC